MSENPHNPEDSYVAKCAHDDWNEGYNAAIEDASKKVAKFPIRSVSIKNSICLEIEALKKVSE